MKIEVEGGELALKNSFGDIVIIPQKNRVEVEGMVKDKCWDCIDAFVNTLPVMAEYAKDGSVVSEAWKEKTGTDWSEAKKRGFTDGSYESNIRLSHELSNPDFSITKEATPQINKAKDYSSHDSFNSAFKSAYKESGAGSFFNYNGRLYEAKMAEEKATQPNTNANKLTQKENITPREKLSPISNTESISNTLDSRNIQNVSLMESHHERANTSEPISPIKNIGSMPSTLKNENTQDFSLKQSDHKRVDTSKIFPEVKEPSIFDKSRKFDRRLMKGANSIVDNLNPKTQVPQHNFKDLETDEIVDISRFTSEVKKAKENKNKVDILERNEISKDTSILDVLHQFTNDTFNTSEMIVNDSKKYAIDLFSKTGELLEKGSYLYDQGISYVKRQIDKSSNELDPVSSNSLNQKMNIPESKYKFRFTEVTGDTINNKGNQYHLAENIDLDKIRVGARNRGDLTELKTKGAIVTAFHRFQNYNDVTSESKTRNYVGLSPTGRVIVGGKDQFKQGDQMSRIIKNRATSFVRDEKGNVRYAKWVDNIIIGGKRQGNKDNPKNPVPLMNMITDNGEAVVGSGLNVLTKKGQADENTYGMITGGRIIMSTGGNNRLISGSVKDLISAFEDMSKKYGMVDLYSLDNGTFNQALRTKDEDLTPQQLKDYDKLNRSGGNFLYMKEGETKPKFKETRFKTPNVRTVNDNSYKKGHSLKNELKAVVFHHTAFEDDPDLVRVTKRFMKTNSSSAHVVIGRNGDRRVFADPEQVTFHAGVSNFRGRDNVNDFGLGIEFQGNTEKKPLSKEQIQSAIEYLTPIVHKYKIPIENFTSHHRISPSRKPDDIRDWQLELIMKEVKKNLYELK